MFTSHGVCEICGKRKDCNEIKSSELIDKKEKQVINPYTGKVIL